MEIPDGKPAPHNTSSPHELLSRAIALVRNGTLPRESAPGVLAGPGKNKSCALCGAAIAPGTVEYEMTSTQADGSSRAYCLHIPCYHAWKQACHSAGY
jgi:hypothetical protein